MKSARISRGLWVAMLATGVGLPVLAEPVWNVRDIPLERVSVVAHRGAGFLAPENTMEALELSWSMGCIPELDVRTTRDGHIMMFHDDNFARILPHAPEEMRRKRLEDLTYAEARELDIGAFRGPEHAGQKIVSLAEIVEALKRDRRRAAYLDVKNVDFGQLARETEAVWEQVVLATGKEADCKRWKQVAPRSDTFLWVGTWGNQDDAPVEARFAKLRADGFAHIDRLQVHCHFDKQSGKMVPSDEWIRRAGVELRRQGIEFQTMPWNAPESPEAYVRLLDLGTAGFGTDRPDVAMETLREYYRAGADKWNARDHIPVENFLIMAHRGAGKLAPEGTREAFELAWDMGCVPEADLRTSKDGAIVSFHDSTLARVLPGAPEERQRKGVAELTLEEIRELDVGSFRGAKFAGQKVLELGEMVNLLRGHPERLLYLDIKQVSFPQLAAQTAGVQEQLIVASSNYEELREWRMLAPRSRTLLWIPGPSPRWVSGDPARPKGPQAKLERRLNAAREAGFSGVDQIQIHVNTGPDGVFYPGEDFLRRLGKELRDHGVQLQILPRGQREPAVIHRLLDLGVASLATDAPDAISAAVRRYYQDPS